VLALKKASDRSRWSRSPATVRSFDHVRVAPLWKRSVASWVDGLPWVAVGLLLVRRRDQSKAPQVLATLMAGAYEVAAPTIFGGTVGQRVCNLRVISTETGRSPTLRQSLVLWAVREMPKLALTWWPMSWQLKQSITTMKALKPEIEELEKKHRGDREAKRQAIIALYEERDVNPIKPVLPLILRPTLSFAYGRLLSASLRRDPLNQGFAGRRANVVLIDERPSSFPRLTELIGRRGAVPSAGGPIQLPVRKGRAA
jgi:hypothetical protein